jgi:hypothetical protein
MTNLDLVNEIPGEYLIPAQDDLNRLVRYLAAALSNPDPVRISVLLGQGLIEEMIDDFIKEAIPNHELLKLHKMGFTEKLRWTRALEVSGSDDPFWKVVEAFYDVRNAAAHRNWEEKRADCFQKVRQLAAQQSDFPIRVSEDDQQFVRSIMSWSFGYLCAARDSYRRMRSGIGIRLVMTEPERAIDPIPKKQ